MAAYIEREDMPQISFSNLNDLFEKLKNDNIKYEKVSIQPGALIQMQRLNREKVKSLKSADSKQKPVIISNENKIVDGHHRWAAKRELGEKIDCIKINMPFEDCIKYLKSWDKSFSKSLQEEALDLKLLSYGDYEIAVSINGNRYTYILDGDLNNHVNKVKSLMKYKKKDALDYLKSKAHSTYKHKDFRESFDIESALESICGFE